MLSVTGRVKHTPKWPTHLSKLAAPGKIWTFWRNPLTINFILLERYKHFFVGTGRCFTNCSQTHFCIVATFYTKCDFWLKTPAVFLFRQQIDSFHKQWQALTLVDCVRRRRFWSRTLNEYGHKVWYWFNIEVVFLWNFWARQSEEKVKSYNYRA